MTDVDRKTGVYTAFALTNTDFTFWWGDDAKPTEYFDVSIEPTHLFLRWFLWWKYRGNIPWRPQHIVKLW